MLEVAVRFIGTVLLLTCPCLLLAGCADPPGDGRECTGMLGNPLYAPPTDDARRAALEAEIEAARTAYAGSPTEDNAIWLGRRLAYAGKYREAIRVYTDALRAWPTSHRLLRHRGHRFITLREFDDAVADLSRAWTLVQSLPDAVEPDGQPTVVDGVVIPPRSTDQTNILYHLGLAHFLKGDFARAVEIFSRRRDLPEVNDDNLVSSMHWEYIALRRLGRVNEAAELVGAVRDGMDVRENRSYYALVRLYAGLIDEDDPALTGRDGGAASVGIRYGLAIRRLYHHDNRAGAVESLRAIVQDHPDENWPSFGFIAAEADLARLSPAVSRSPR